MYETLDKALDKMVAERIQDRTDAADIKTVIPDSFNDMAAYNV